MSKIKNGRLHQYGAEPFNQQQFGTAGDEGVNWKVTLCIVTVNQNCLVFWLNGLACSSRPLPAVNFSARYQSRGQGQVLALSTAVYVKPAALYYFWYWLAWAKWTHSKSGAKHHFIPRSASRLSTRATVRRHSLNTSWSSTSSSSGLDRFSSNFGTTPRTTPDTLPPGVHLLARAAIVTFDNIQYRPLTSKLAYFSGTYHVRDT